MYYLPLLMGLMDPFSGLFGQILSKMVDWLGSYGLAVIVFTILLMILSFPLGLKQKKNMLKQSALQDDINEIARLYPKDMQKQNELRMELMRRHGISQMSGCLPMILQMLVFFSMWRPIQQPLHYIGQVSTANIEHIRQFLVQNSWLPASINEKYVLRNDIPIIDILTKNAKSLYGVVENGWMELRQMIDLNFLGIDLGMRPTINPKLLFGAETWRTYLPLLILPALTLITLLINMRMMKLEQPNYQSKEEREREKRNPAKAGQNPDPTAGMMKSMNYVFPVLMMFTVFSLPTAMGLFWVTRNLVMIAQSALTYFLYHRPFRAQQAAINAKRSK
ncbi:MAG: YidC/Oxa1 family membrane protein insertase [Eubacteriales bacterium]|nr:YidC/Oxa1 family membrane protein insertase [Eubacteriales bacterium]